MSVGELWVLLARQGDWLRHTNTSNPSVAPATRNSTLLIEEAVAAVVAAAPCVIVGFVVSG